MNWYAVYTKPRNEKKVAELLGREGIDHYLPLVRREKIWSDRRKMVDEPLFSSYIFVHITEKEHLAVLQTPGVVRFIVFEGKKVLVRDIQIEAIRKFCATGEDLFLDVKDYSVGRKVKVILGGLKGSGRQACTDSRQTAGEGRDRCDTAFHLREDPDGKPGDHSGGGMNVECRTRI